MPAYEEGKISVALFWIEKYKRYRLRILRYKWGYIFSKYYYIPRAISIEFHDGTTRKKIFMLLPVFVLLYIILFVVFSLLNSYLISVHIL
jgi:hypothetical protein